MLPPFPENAERGNVYASAVPVIQLSLILKNAARLKGPSQPHLYVCLLARVGLVYFLEHVEIKGNHFETTNDKHTLKNTTQ